MGKNMSLIWVIMLCVVVDLLVGSASAQAGACPILRRAIEAVVQQEPVIRQVHVITTLQEELDLKRRQGSQKGVADILNKLIKLSPRDAALVLARAELYRSLGPCYDKKAAESCYRAFLDLTKRFAGGRTNDSPDLARRENYIVRRAFQLGAISSQYENVKSMREAALDVLDALGDGREAIALTFADKGEIDKALAVTSKQLAKLKVDREQADVDVQKAEARKQAAEADYEKWRSASRRGAQDPDVFLSKISAAKNTIKRLREREIPKLDKDLEAKGKYHADLELARSRFQQD